MRNRLLGYTDGEIKEIDQQVSYERNVGIIPDPNAQLLQQGINPNNPMQQGPGELQGDMQMAAMGAGDDMDMGGDPAMGGGGSISAGGGMAGGGGAGGPVTMPS